jgi:hypothetical protein
MINPQKIDWEDVILYLHEEIQPQSIEEIMVGLCGESYKYNVPLSKRINQIINMLLYDKSYILSLQRKESGLGLTYKPAATTYYLSYQGGEYIKEQKLISGVMANIDENEIRWFMKKQRREKFLGFFISDTNWKWAKRITWAIATIYALWVFVNQLTNNDKESKPLREYYPSK